MASALVDVVVGKLGGMMIEKMNEEACLVLNFKRDFEWLSKTLTNIKSYLKDADLQSAHNEYVKSWLLDVAEIALDAEDILEECAVESQGTNNETPQSSCVCAFSFCQLVFRYKMARRIKDVKNRMRSIVIDGEKLKLFRDLTHSDQPSTSTSQIAKWRERSSLIDRGSRPVAIESKVEDLLRLIDDPASPVIAVVGMGGVGKTFLLQRVFNRIKDKFEKAIWLSISQTYSLKKLQADLASELASEFAPVVEEQKKRWDEKHSELAPVLERIQKRIEELTSFLERIEELTSFLKRIERVERIERTAEEQQKQRTDEEQKKKRTEEEKRADDEQKKRAEEELSKLVGDEQKKRAEEELSKLKQEEQKKHAEEKLEKHAYEVVKGQLNRLNGVVNGQVSEVQPAEFIHDIIIRYLASKRYLIVLDDVWRATGEVDLISALGIPTGNDTHCKIVVTSRSRHVCSDMNARVYELQTLSQQESWELFCAFAFPDCNPNQPPHQLKGIARQIEGECGRLPLAVKIVAASLKGKTLSSEWESKLRHVKEAFSTDDPIMQIIKLSYDSLPPHLKNCFAFLSFFPEDEEIDSQFLINTWVAEGYIPQGEEQLDIGWEYICELHSLCLLETVVDIYENMSFSKLDTRYKLHDLVLDLAISISKDNKCAFSVKEALSKGPARILMGKKSINDGDVYRMACHKLYSASRLRTLSLSHNGPGIQIIPPMLLSSARVLRVLDLSHTKISSLPACVENLKLLRVLNLRGTNITGVPECVRSNKSLRFLDISHCSSLKGLPNWIGELNCLEHLDMKDSSNIDGLMPKGISKLVSLQVLRLHVQRSDGFKLSIEENEFLKLDHFANLINLREVHIDIHHEVELKSIEDGILAMLVKMRTLTINNQVACDANVCNPPHLSEKMLAMKDLEFLFLQGFAVPNWIYGFYNLMKLFLSRCHCAEYPALQMMPNLISLDLLRNEKIKAFPKGFGKPGGFPQLRYFRIREFSVLEELSELEDGAMPRLDQLTVQDCPNLKKAPIGLELLKSLKGCYFANTGVTDMFKEGGELWNKMKANNPNVNITSLDTNEEVSDIDMCPHDKQIRAFTKR